MKCSERILRYQCHGLGLKRNELQLVPPNGRWKRIFAEEAHLIYDQLRLEDLRLYHCGSTSVPGLPAKPVIDIVGSVGGLAQLESRKRELEEIGYEWKGEYGIPGRRYSVLHDSNRDLGLAHLHIFTHGSPEVESHLLFRDFLRANREACIAYQEEKARLLAGGTPRDQYANAKSAIVSSLLEQASAWKKRDPSVLAILGSAKGGANTRAFLRERYPEADVVELATLPLNPFSYAGKGEDDFSRLVHRMLQADLVVFATPVYWYAMSGALKDFFDRFTDLLEGELKPLGEALNGKKFRLLSTGSDERLPLGFETPFASTAIYLGMDYLGAEYRSMGHG